jgi:aminoglycoside phosphotransferase (APT) family kinase protein
MRCNPVGASDRSRDHPAMSATPVPTARSPRIEWSQVPARVRRAVEDELGSPVASAVTQHGGFSPGAAVRVVLADGRRLFVKAVGSDLNPDTPDLNRAEIVALRLLPADVPAARLVTSYDDGDWVALVLEDVDGRRPGVPWSAADVRTVGRTLAGLAVTTGHPELPTFAEVVLALSAWDDVHADPRGVDPGLLDRLPEMLDQQRLAHEVTRGDVLVHWDVRADNVLVRDGQAVLVDWAWACRGAPWLDTLLVAMDLRIQGGPDADGFLRAHPATRDVPGEHLAALLACMVGVWTERARRPPPPGLPTIRRWQAHCAAAALDWLDRGALWR